MTEADFANSLVEMQLRGRRWGARGASCLERIQSELGLVLPAEMSHFVNTFGNFQVDPLSVNVTGNEDGQGGSVPATRQLWRTHPSFRELGGILVMQHAAISYIYNSSTTEVLAVELFPQNRHDVLQSWESLENFILWVFQEARRINRPEGLAE